MIAYATEKEERWHKRWMEVDDLEKDLLAVWMEPLRQVVLKEAPHSHPSAAAVWVATFVVMSEEGGFYARIAVTKKDLDLNKDRMDEILDVKFRNAVLKMEDILLHDGKYSREQRRNILRGPTKVTTCYA